MEAMAVSLLYLERFCLSGAINIPVDLLTIHRLILVCTMAASHYHDDAPYLCQRWAKIGGVKANELVELQVLFQQWTDFRFHVTEFDFAKFVKYDE